MALFLNRNCLRGPACWGGESEEEFFNSSRIDHLYRVFFDRWEILTSKKNDRFTVSTPRMFKFISLL